MNIRKAVIQDCPDMLDVMFSTSMSKESSWWKNTIQSLEEKLNNDGAFIAIEDNKIVGTVSFVLHNGAMNLRGLAVRPEYEKRGIGGALIQAVENEAIRRKTYNMLLAVSQSNLEVVAYYQNMDTLLAS